MKLIDVLINELEFIVACGCKNSTLHKYNFNNTYIASCLKNLVLKNPYFCDFVCPDAYFLISSPLYNVSSNKQNIANDFRRIFVDYNYVDNTKNYILILLESPHKDEYSKFKLPLGPAMGVTGDNLEGGFVNMLLSGLSGYNCIKSNKLYDVVLMNCIQFQTSGGAPIVKENKKKRDKAWLSMWNCCCNDLVIRINKFVSSCNDVIIINLCTKSKGKKAKVTSKISGNFPKLPLFEGYHPSCWKFKKTAKLKNIN